MKKRFVVALFASLLLCNTLTGCGIIVDSLVSELRPETPAPNGANESSSSIPGTYDIPDGWVIAENISTNEKIFYVKEGCENSDKPDNISVSVGKNKYRKSEHERFRSAIVQQLTMQLRGKADGQLSGQGTYTKEGDYLYRFTVTEKESTTTQYYIVKDYGFCLIHLTNFSGSEDADKAAEAMAESFVWNSGK